MPRRSGGGFRSTSPSRAPPPRPTRAVAPPPPPAAAPPPAGRQPGLFGQMAAIAGGVAIGHTIGDAITGRHRGNDQPVDTLETTGPNDQSLYQNPGERYSTDRCNLYQKEFMKCLDNANGDSKQCQGFWEALKECQQYQNSATN